MGTLMEILIEILVGILMGILMGVSMGIKINLPAGNYPNVNLSSWSAKEISQRI